MKTFLTGATGYVGSVVTEKLQQVGHQVVALARSDSSAETLMARGIEVVRGDLDSVENLGNVVRESDAVIHTAFKFDGGDFEAAVATEAKVVRTLIRSLQGTDKPLIVTSGTAILGNTGDRVFDEQTHVAMPPENSSAGGGMDALKGRLRVEKEVLEAQGVYGIVLRPPNVYERSDGKSILTMLRFAGQSFGAVPYAAGTADHKWSFVHVDDLADLYVLALERAKAGELFHASSQTGLRTKAIAEALSRGLGLGGKIIELEMSALGDALGFPPLAEYWAINSQSSGEKARKVLGWQPKHLDMLTDLAHGQFPSASSSS